MPAVSETASPLRAQLVRSLKTIPPEVRQHARRGWPVALVLAVALGVVVGLGALVANATPTEEQPEGWPGAAKFDNGVAMFRTQALLAATIPALLLGYRTARTHLRERPGQGGAGRFVAADASLLVVGVLIATVIASWIAAGTALRAYLVFWAAHSLLALAFYSLAFMAAALAPRRGLAVAAGVWLGFVALYDALVRWRLFRAVNYEALTSGLIPAWFYAAQVASPVAAYRGLLILAWPGFRDWEEQAVLRDAQLPSWASPVVFLAFLLLWILVPLAIGSIAMAKRNRTTRPKVAPMPAAASPAPALVAAPAPQATQRVMPAPRPGPVQVGVPPPPPPSGTPEAPAQAAPLVPPWLR